VAAVVATAVGGPGSRAHRDRHAALFDDRSMTLLKKEPIPMPTPSAAIARRVAARHLHAQTDPIPIVYAEGGIVSWQAVCRLAEPTVGRLVRVWFHPGSDANSVAWDGVRLSGELVEGHIQFTSVLNRDDQIVSFGWLYVDEPKTKKAARRG
jgi:hypothetical protein